MPLANDDMLKYDATLNAFVPVAGGLLGPVIADGGTVARSLSEHFGDILSVKDFGAVGDGTTSDQAALVAAVAYGFANGKPIHWPFGTYVSPNNIPNFHNVQHYGMGSVKRGANIFYITPLEVLGNTNSIYSSPSGSAANDGLSSSQPTTNASIYTILRRYANPCLRGRWEVVLAAGTYTTPISTRSQTLPGWPLTIKGPSRGHPNAPTAIIDLASMPSEAGVKFGGVGGWISVVDVEVKNAVTGEGFSTVGAWMSLVNCRSTNCKQGIDNQHGGFMRVAGGEYDGNNIVGGIGYMCIYGSTHNLSATSLSTAALFKNYETSLALGEGAFGHMDYLKIHDCGVGLQMNQTDCGANTKNMQIWRCGIGVQARNASWRDNSIDYGSGADACVINVQTSGDAPESNFRTRDYQSRTSRLQNSAYNLNATSGSTVNVWNAFQSPLGYGDAGHVTEIKASGTCSLAAGTNLIIYRLNSTSPGNVIIPVAATKWSIEISIMWINATQVIASFCLVTDAGTVVENSGPVTVGNTVALDNYFRVGLAAGSSLNIAQIKAYTTFGG